MSAAATTRVLLQTISGVLLQTISNEKKKKEKLIICSGQWSGPRKREREREVIRHVAAPGTRPDLLVSEQLMD